MFEVYDSSSSPPESSSSAHQKEGEKKKKSQRETLESLSTFSAIDDDVECLIRIQVGEIFLWHMKPFWASAPMHFGHHFSIFIHSFHTANTCNDCCYFQSLNRFSIFPCWKQRTSSIGIIYSNGIKQTQTRRDNKNNFHSMRVSFYLRRQKGYLFVLALCVVRVWNENVTMHLNVQQNRCLPISVLFVCQWVCLSLHAILVLLFTFGESSVSLLFLAFSSLFIHKMRIKSDVRTENKWNWLN